MNFIIALFVTIAYSSIAFAQTNKLKDKALQEIDSLIANPFEFLGKTRQAIMAAGRPSSIKGGDKWEAEVSFSHEKNEMDASAGITIGTGCGGLLLIISATTKQVFTMTFIPHKKSRLDGMDILNYLKGKYQFDQKGNSSIQTKDSSFIALSVLKGAILIIALQDDKKEIRFKN